MDCLFVEPAEADHEPETLLGVCQGEIVYKYHIVVVSEWASVVFLPENEPICKETEERECCQQGDCCDARDGNESLSLLRVKGLDIFMGS